MLNHEIIIKRLALIKQLYRIGVEQSRQFETIASFSILSFHDAIEMFLKLLAEHNNVKSDNLNFLDYWTHFPNMTLKESMRSLNARRVNIKHKGLLPSKSDIEVSKINTTDFFEQNTKLLFGIEFNDVSILSLISYEEARTNLEKAQSTLNSNKIEDSIKYSAIAFSELLFGYENSKTKHGSSPFFFGRSLTFNSAFSMDIKDRKMGEFVDKVKESLESMQDAIKIISFGIDYKRFLKFKMLTPYVMRTYNGVHVSQMRGGKKWTKENCQYCIDFVSDCALKLQEFDFAIDEIDESLEM